LSNERFVLGWNRDDSIPFINDLLSNRVKSVMDSPHGMWNYMTYRDAINILGLDASEIYKEGRIDLDSSEWADFGWMVCYMGPPKSAIKAMCKHTTSEFINPYSPDLINPLREACARLKFKRERGKSFEVIGTEGAQAGVSYVLQTLVDPGDEVIITDPGYFHFESAILMAGGVTVRIPLSAGNNYRLNPEEVETVITSRTRIIIICDPINPFGTVQRKDELIEIVKMAQSRNIIIINDITHDTHRIDTKAAHYPIASLWRDTNVDNVCSTFSVSHGYGMASVRMGFLSGHPDLMRACLISKVALSRLNTNLVAQYGALAALNDQDYVNKSELKIRRNYAIIKDIIKKTKGLSIPVEPQYGFSMIVDVSGAGVTAQELTVSLFKRRVVVYPGDGLGNVGATDYLRLNISRPDKFAFEKLRDSLSEAIAEAKSGVYRKKIINFFEKKSTERAKWIVQKIKERL